MPKSYLLIGTGGTIAGRASDAADLVSYQAGSVGVSELIGALPELAQWPLQVEQLAQLDSKDMDFATWTRLAQRIQQALDDPDIAAILVTHGTDTLEETAYFLHRVLQRQAKPVVLTAAMRPASSRSPDGPQNLLDALVLAAEPGARGVLVAVQGEVHRADRVRKVHSYSVNAFASPDSGPVARVENGCLRALASWPQAEGLGVLALERPWPRVELLWNAAGADGAVVPLFQELAAREGRRLGLVVAGTGNGTLSQALEAALRQAQAQGVAVLRASRCGAGPVIGGGLPSAGSLSPVQARVELLLRLLLDPRA